MSQHLGEDDFGACGLLGRLHALLAGGNSRKLLAVRSVLCAQSASILTSELRCVAEGRYLTSMEAGCHFVNECAQLAQGYRYIQYWQYVFPFDCTRHSPVPPTLSHLLVCLPTQCRVHIARETHSIRTLCFFSVSTLPIWRRSPAHSPACALVLFPAPWLLHTSAASLYTHSPSPSCWLFHALCFY